MTSYVAADLRRSVESRANHLCEFYLACFSAMLTGSLSLALPGNEDKMDTIESAIAGLQSPDKATRIAGLISLARHGQHAAVVVADLIRYGGRVTDRQELGILVELLGVVGDHRAVPFLITALESNLEGMVGKPAATSLGQIGDAAALPFLLSARHGPNKRVRKAAREAVEKFR